MASKNLELFLVGRDLSASKAVKGLGQELDKSATIGSKFGSVVKTGLLAGVGAAAALGVSAVHMASQFQDAEARLQGAVTNVGGSFDQLKPKVDDLDSKMAKLGFTGTDVESALAGLVTATKDPTKAIGLMGLAADIARGRNIDLATATGILVKVETGHVSLLGRLGIATKDATGKTISSEQAVKRLSDLYGGDAQRSADTFAGKVRALKAEAEDLGVKVGRVLIPIISGLATVLLDTVGAVSGVAHWLDANKAAAAALGTVLAAALVPTFAVLVASAYRFVTVNMANALILAADAALEFAGNLALADLALAPIIIAAAAVAVVVVRSWESQKKAIDAGKKSADDYSNSLVHSTTSVDTMQAATTQLTAKLNEQTATVTNLAQHGSIVSDSFFQQLGALKEYSDQLDIQKQKQTAIANNQSVLAHAYHLTTAQVETLAAVNNIDLTGSLDGVQTAFKKAMTATQATHKPMSIAQADFKKVGDRSLTASDQVKALKDAFDELIGKSVDAHGSVVTFYNDLATLNEKLKASKGSMDLTTQAGRDAAAAFDQLVHDTNDVSAAQKDANYSTATMKATLDKEIAALEKAGGNSAYARGEIAKLKHEEDLLFPAIQNVNAALSQVPNNPYSGVHIPSTGGVGGTGKFSARGGLVSGPGTKTSDSVLMHLSNDEFVMQASAVDRFGLPFMRALNDGKLVTPQLRTSGIVAPGMAAATVIQRAGDMHVHLHGVMAGSEQQLLRWVDRGLKRLSVKGYATNN